MRNLSLLADELGGDQNSDTSLTSSIASLTSLASDSLYSLRSIMSQIHATSSARFQRSLTGDEEDITASVKISDEEFRRIINDLKKSGVITTAGVKEYLKSQKQQKRREEIEEECRTGSSSVETTKRIDYDYFDQCQSFRHVVAKSVAEASKTPIYRRTSDEQMLALKRISVVKWEVGDDVDHESEKEEEEEQQQQTELRNLDYYVVTCDDDDDGINAIDEEEQPEELTRSSSSTRFLVGIENSEKMMKRNSSLRNESLVKQDSARKSRVSIVIDLSDLNIGEPEQTEMAT